MKFQILSKKSERWDLKRSFLIGQCIAEHAVKTVLGSDAVWLDAKVECTPIVPATRLSDKTITKKEFGVKPQQNKERYVYFRDVLVCLPKAGMPRGLSVLNIRVEIEIRLFTLASRRVWYPHYVAVKTPLMNDMFTFEVGAIDGMHFLDEDRIMADQAKFPFLAGMEMAQFSLSQTSPA